ncbi:2-isopropylmalate synthase [Candidatus Dojkabacteria bacterium]|nr:2-isopropylmalate synthase [Candidatus Dojkabacteria bacterium]
MDKIIIFDTTLRDGEQVPGAKLNVIEKIEIAKQLEILGVDVIEAGFPISSPEDFKAVQEVAKVIKHSSVCGLARGLDKDIESAAKAIEKATRPRLHTFISASDIHIENQMKKSREEVLEMVYKAVTKAKSLIDDIEFSPMDASRADIDYLIKFIKIAIDAGARTINIPDTVGYAMPDEFGKMINSIVNSIDEIKSGKIILSVHTHNDLGLAAANALSGIENGARQIEGTINGIGERAGNCAIEEIIMILKTRYKTKYEVGINTKEIFKTSRLVSQIMGLQVQRNKAIVGQNAFAHSSGIHQDGIIKHRQNFEIMDPKDVGVEESGIILTARSGRSALMHRLKKIGFTYDKNSIESIYEKFLQLADQKKEINDEDLKTLVLPIKSNSKNLKMKYEIDLLQVICGNKNIPTATVRIKNRVKNTIYEEVATGAGPVDAAYSAINKIFDSFNKQKYEIVLKEYLVQAITEGVEAEGKVSVQIEYKKERYFGYGSNDDIVVASVEAYIDAVNKI